MATSDDGAAVHFPPPLIYLGGLVLGWFGGRLLRVPHLGLPSAVAFAVGAILATVGLFVSIGSIRRFIGERTAIIPFKPATTLVTSGAYSWTRNPMYLSMALIFAGIAIGGNNLAELIMLPFVVLLVQTQVIAREEAYLERRFGTEYRTYKSRVRRWI